MRLDLDVTFNGHAKKRADRGGLAGVSLCARMPFEVPEVDDSTAPPLVLVDGAVAYREHGGRAVRPLPDGDDAPLAFRRDLGTREPVPSTEVESVKWGGHLYLEDDPGLTVRFDRQERADAISRVARKGYVVVEGRAWKACPDPVYRVALRDGMPRVTVGPYHDASEAAPASFALDEAGILRDFLQARYGTVPDLPDVRVLRPGCLSLRPRAEALRKAAGDACIHARDGLWGRDHRFGDLYFRLRDLAAGLPDPRDGTEGPEATYALLREFAPMVGMPRYQAATVGAALACWEVAGADVDETHALVGP